MKKSPTKQKLVIADVEVQEKQEQYQIIKLGAICIEYGVDGEMLLKAIDFIQSMNKQ